MKKELPPEEFDEMVEAQRLIILDGHSLPDEKSEGKYNKLPPGVNHPTDLYDTSLPDYSNKLPDWLKIIDVTNQPSEKAFDDSEGL
jgi:hypothetical protein